MKCVIDCSKPPGEQITMRPLTKRDLARQKRDRAEGEIRMRAESYVRLRHVRDHLLRVTDHYAGEPAWDRWRQKLRDLPATVKDPEKPRWPKPPANPSCLFPCRSLWPRMDWTPLTQGSD